MAPSYRLKFNIRPDSKYADQAKADNLFYVYDIAPRSDYCIIGGPGGQYRMRDVTLFAEDADGRTLVLKE